MSVSPPLQGFQVYYAFVHIALAKILFYWYLFFMCSRHSIFVWKIISINLNPQQRLIWFNVFCRYYYMIINVFIIIIICHIKFQIPFFGIFVNTAFNLTNTVSSRFHAELKYRQKSVKRRDLRNSLQVGVQCSKDILRQQRVKLLDIDE